MLYSAVDLSLFFCVDGGVVVLEGLEDGGVDGVGDVVRDVVGIVGD
jgi:hypothetical protein